MKQRTFNIWVWQRIISPHMAGLSTALTAQGHTTTYVTERTMSEDRARQGWQAPEMPGVRLLVASSPGEISRLVDDAPSDSIHICQGIRSNGSVGFAQHALKRRGLKQWVVMETVEDKGLSGIAKRLVYRALFMQWNRHLQGVLATGWQTTPWLCARGVPEHKVFPFAYFLPEPEDAITLQPGEMPFRFLFVGQFIELKRLDLLIDTLGTLGAVENTDFRLQVIGSGPEEESLHRHGERVLGHRLEWIGQLPMSGTRRAMRVADCLVLPSRHDGWGAVVSEALMAGTPAIVSNACGSAGVVLASGAGGVFPASDGNELSRLLLVTLRAGAVSVNDRTRLALWARCLGADAGADYLIEIYEYIRSQSCRPKPPWSQST